ncbi:MAG TPA: ABC transporter permease, partial [Vicinamibacterales bacterium]|nr:ABC transporter permease [Vicinamibacterales bacterium]
MTNSYAWRSLQRTPAFTIAAILTLVLGIASVGSMFAVVHGVLLAPLPYTEPERLVSLSLQSAAQRRILQPPAVFATYQQFAQRLDAVGFYRSGNANIWAAGADGEAPERLTATWVSVSLLPLLQVSPLLGRGFTADEARFGGANAVILSESLWRTRFNAAPDVIGKTLIVNSVPREIVGVMPARFPFPTADTRVWLPVRAMNNALVGDFAYQGVARLAVGATAEQAQRELAAILPSLAVSFPRLESGGATATWLEEVKPTPVVQPLHDEVTGDIAPTLWMLAAVAGLVLLVAWANVANLMLIRADGHQLELATRAALGASRLRVASHFLGEAVLLGIAAAALALVASYGAVRLLVAYGPADIPRLSELGIAPMTIAFIVLVTAVSVIVCAAVPALRVRHANLSSQLRDGGRGESAGKARQRLRASIAALQIAVALVVTVSAALLLRTTQRLHDVHPGFAAGDVTTLWTQLPFARYGDAAAVAFYVRLVEQVRQLPSVSAAGLTMRLPLTTGESLTQSFRSEGEARTLTLPVNVVDAGYFTALRIPLLAGRSFQPTEQAQGDEILISQRAAATLFGDPRGSTAVGKHLTLAPTGPTYTVIGVVGDVREHDLATE